MRAHLFIFIVTVKLWSTSGGSDIHPNLFSAPGGEEFWAPNPWHIGMSGIRTLTTTVIASTQIALTSDLKNDTIINLGDDIFLTSSRAGSPTGVVINNGQRGLIIDGLGLYEVNGQNAVRCFYISGGSVNVAIQNLVITKGNGNGGGLYIKSEAEVLLKSCTIIMNNGIGLVESIGGGINMTSATVSLINCAIVDNRAHRGGGIDSNHGLLLLVGCLFSGNKNYGASDLQLSNNSYVTVLSSCKGDSYNAGQGALQCAGCSTAYPADVLSGECAACPSLDPYSCCGALGEGDCTTRNTSACSEDENYVCSAISSPTSAPSMTPTLLPVPTIAPTPRSVLHSTFPTDFTVLVGGATTVTIIFVLLLRRCFTSGLRQKSFSRRTAEYEDFVSPFLNGPQNHVDFDFAPGYIYSDHIDRTTEGSKRSISRGLPNSHEIASTYGVDQTFEGSSEHDPGAYDPDTVPFDILISHLNRHGLEFDVAEEIAVYFSVSFGVQSVGDFRLLEERDILKAIEDMELLKIQASRLRIAWR